MNSTSHLQDGRRLGDVCGLALRSRVVANYLQGGRLVQGNSTFAIVNRVETVSDCSSVLIGSRCLEGSELHEDAIHRGPAQTIPAVRNAIKGALLRADSVLFEPIQKIRIDAPSEWAGGITRQLITRRGVIEDMPVENDVTCVIGKMPVAESFGFSNDIRAATQGRAVWNTENAGYDQVPPELFHKIVGDIRRGRASRKKFQERPNTRTDCLF